MILSPEAHLYPCGLGVYTHTVNIFCSPDTSNVRTFTNKSMWLFGLKKEMNKMSTINFPNRELNPGRASESRES